MKAPAGGSLVEVTRDESIRPSTTVDVLAGLRPAFRADVWEQRFPQLDWKVTAGNSSPVNDGAAALLITSSETAAGSACARGPACTASPSSATTRCSC